MIGRALFALAAVAGLSSCNETGWSSRECHIQDDQQGAFMARVPDFPISIYVDSSFTDGDRQSITSAVSEWNARGRQLIESDFFTIAGNESYEGRRPSVTDCGEGLGLAQNAMILMNEKSTSGWDQASTRRTAGTTAVGVTLRCALGAQVQRQVTVLNNSGSARIDTSQLSSVVVHELGHALGLDHSCDNGAGKKGWRSCQGLAINHPYHLAVMYPTLQMPQNTSGWIEVKDHVQANDADRLQCLYGPK
jgi:hypothetical protein